MVIQAKSRKSGDITPSGLHAEIPEQLKMRGGVAERFSICIQHPLTWALPIQAALFFWRLNLLDPWGDEGYTLATAPRSLAEIASDLAANIHPPFYYFLLHFWIQVSWGSTLIGKMRAFSAVWGLIATVILYFLWLRREEPRFQRTVLALWILSPSLLLYARMARSYTMQLALALIAIHAAVQWLDRPQDRRRATAYVVSCAALLYTHYLPGLAIIAAASLILLVRGRLMAVAASVVIIMLTYLPWLSAIREALTNWTSSHAYRLGSLAADIAARLVFWFISFSFGETLSAFSLLLCALLTPFVVYALWRGIGAKPDWLGLVLIASAVAFVGVSQWSGYFATPSHVLFALPFFLMIITRGFELSVNRRILILAPIAIVYVLGASSYFARSGYMNGGYAMPNEQIAAMIHNGSPDGNAVLVLDSTFPQPLLDRLGQTVRVILFSGDESAQMTRDVALRRKGPLWFCRRTHDTSPDGLLTRLEVELTKNHTVRYHEFLPYSIIERAALRWLRGPGQPASSYRCLEIQ